MIYFQKVRYKNLLSTGNVFIEIDLNSAKTTLLSGQNGAGKSTVIEAIIFALYGKPFRKISKPQLVNTVNQKDLLVELEFQIGSSSFLIRRGIKPAIFEIYKDDVLLNQSAAIKDYQEFLEENILKINYKAFTQIVILGSATYIPFMELPAASRREVIEDLLDLQIFSTMNILLKDKLSKNKTAITETRHGIELLESKIQILSENSEQLEQKRLAELADLKEKLNTYLGHMTKQKAELSELEAQIEELKTQITEKESLLEKKQKYDEVYYDLKSKQREKTKELEFLTDHDHCPTCSQEIDETFKKDKVSHTNSELLLLVANITKLESILEKLKSNLLEITKVEKKISEIQIQKASLSSSIKNYLNNMKEIAKSMEKLENEKPVDISNLEEYNTNLQTLEETLQAVLEEKILIDSAALLLKDGGIKTSLVNHYIPVMNQLINQYLAAFDLFVDFQLDENFNEVIRSRYRDAFSYASFSEGEKLRINLSILMTWRTISRMRNSVSTNLLCLDETLDGALDGSGIDQLLETLNQINEDDNIFVISHRGSEFGDKFDRHLKFEKKGNFSEMITE